MIGTIVLALIFSALTGLVLAGRANIQQRDEQIQQLNNEADQLLTVALDSEFEAMRLRRHLTIEQTHSTALGETLQRSNQRVVAHERTIEFLLNKIIEQDKAIVDLLDDDWFANATAVLSPLLAKVEDNTPQETR